MSSHVDRVPVEVLARCFLLSTEGSVPTLSLREPPLLLLLVCRRWRDIALTTPRLWSKVLAEIDTSMCDKESTVSTFKTSLSRSKSLPLDIFIKELDNRYCHRSSSEIIFPTVLDQASRLHELHLNVVNIPTIPDGLPLFPALRKATLLIGEGVNYSALADLHRLLEKAPVLDSLTIPSLMVEDQFSEAFYQQLVKLRVVSAPWYSFVDTELVLEGLAGFSNLKVLAIDSMRNHRFIEDKGLFTASIELPHLLYLSVRADDTRLFPAILRSISSPVLESVSLDVPFCQTDAGHAFHAINRLFETHSSTIKSLAYHVTFAMNEHLARGMHIVERSYKAYVLNDPRRYDAQTSMYRELWSNARNVESLVLCDHTECSITWLECLCTFIVRFDEDNPLLVVDSTSHMHQLRDLTIQIRPIASEWYFDRFVTILYNIVASRIRLRQTTTFGNPSSSIPDSDRHCFKLRVVFIIDPPLSSIFIQDKTDTASNVPLPELFSPRACIEHCISIIRDKLQVFVSPAELQHEQLDSNRSGNLDLSFDVLQEEKDMYCEDSFDVPYDARFVPKRELVQRWDEYDEFF